MASRRLLAQLIWQCVPCLLAWPVLFLLCRPCGPVVEKAILGLVVMVGGVGERVAIWDS